LASRVNQMKKEAVSGMDNLENIFLGVDGGVRRGVKEEGAEEAKSESTIQRWNTRKGRQRKSAPEQKKNISNTPKVEEKEPFASNEKR